MLRTKLILQATVILLILLGLAATLVACATPSTPSPKAEAPTAAAQKTPEQKAQATAVPAPTMPPPAKFKGTVVVGEWQEPKGLLYHVFPAAHNEAILRSIYYRPVRLNEKDQLIPEMLQDVPTVKNGGISADYKTITLKFKDGFKWHDGKPVTSDDLKFTWQFVMDPKTMAGSQEGWDRVESIDTPDKLTAVLHFKSPAIGFVEGRLIEPLMPKHLLEGVADPGNSEYARKPVGNGPFVFKEWVAGDHFTVVANPDAPIPPKLEKIIFKFVPDANTLIAMLRVGDIDVGWDLRETHIPELKKMANVETVLVPGVAIERYNFNLRDPKDLSKPHPILSDVKVRKAIALGTDRLTFVDKLLGGYGKVAVTDMDNTPWFKQDLKSYPYDPEAAKKLLDEAGWKVGSDGIRVKNGVRLSLKHSTTAGNQLRENAQVFFQQNLKDIGVEMIIENYPAATLFGGCNDKGIWGTSAFDIIAFSSGASTLDWPSNFPEDFLCKNVKDCKNNPGGANANGYCDAELDKKLVCVQSEIDPDKRMVCIKDVQQMLYDLYYPLYIYDRVEPYAIAKRVQGIKPTPFGKHSYNYVEWSVTGD